MPQENPSKNVGLLGGTFNPVHWGHINLGLAVPQLFPIGRIEFILSAHPPHKSGPQIVAPLQRFSMLQQALAPHPHLLPNRCEMDRQTPSWSLLTVRDLMQDSPDHAFYFICGSEAFLAIQTWYQYRRLLDTVGFLVFPRHGDHLPGLKTLCQTENLRIHLTPPTLPTAGEVTLFTAPAETLSISSTDIRERIRTGRAYDRLLPEATARAIKENKLYV
jgi:nicotinate-nucleotide adenylyltransferase